MKILIVNNTLILALKYGETERVIWYLGKELVKLGHQVDYLVNLGSACPFVKEVLLFDENKAIEEQIPDGYDIVHFNFNVDADKIKTKHIVIIHGNTNEFIKYNRNSVFVSKNHHQSNSYVYNGLDFEDYGIVDFDKEKVGFHFLGNVVWKEKNTKGAIDIARRAKEKIIILEGERFSFKMGVKFFPQLNAKFVGQVDEKEKSKFINQSKGSIYPVKWSEPFGLAIIESLYYGCPIFGTKHGSLPELIKSEVGFLSNNSEELVEAIKTRKFGREMYHQYAVESFNSKIMVERYLKKYQIILGGKFLNESQPIIKIQQEGRFLDYN